MLPFSEGSGNTVWWHFDMKHLREGLVNSKGVLSFWNSIGLRCQVTFPKFKVFVAESDIGVTDFCSIKKVLEEILARARQTHAYIKTYVELLIFSSQQNRPKNLRVQLRMLLVQLVHVLKITVNFSLKCWETFSSLRFELFSSKHEIFDV